MRYQEVLDQKHEEYIQGMRTYVSELNALPQEEAQRISRAALLRIGVLHE